MTNPQRGVIAGYPSEEVANAVWANLLHNDSLAVMGVNIGLGSLKPAIENVCYVILPIKTIEMHSADRTTVTILESELEALRKEIADLKKRDRLLTALEQGGVDDWEWYDESIQDFEKANPEKAG